MASAKDTFESHTFAGATFACGTWRGTGVTAVPKFPGDTEWARAGPGSVAVTRAGPGSVAVTRTGPGDTTWAKRES